MPSPIQILQVLHHELRKTYPHAIINYDRITITNNLQHIVIKAISTHSLYLKASIHKGRKKRDKVRINIDINHPELVAHVLTIVDSLSPHTYLNKTKVIPSGHAIYRYQQRIQKNLTKKQVSKLIQHDIKTGIPLYGRRLKRYQVFLALQQENGEILVESKDLLKIYPCSWGKKGLHVCTTLTPTMNLNLPETEV